MALRSRLFPLILCLAALLSACGSSSSPGASAAVVSQDASLVETPSATASSPSPAFPVELIDDAGRRVALGAHPERIISLAPSNTEIVCALGACDRIVGVNDFRDGFPPDVATALADVPDVASFSGVDREAVVAAEPDLVLAAGNELTSTADIEAMTALGLPVLVLYPESLDGVYADITLVGRAIGEEATAAGLTAQMRSRVDDVRSRVAGLDEPRTFYEVGIYEGAIYTAGADSFLASLIGLAGGDAITGDALSTAIQLEDLVAADPQLILLGDAAYDATITADAVAARPGWSTMTAVRGGRVLPMPADLLITRPGPRIVDGLEALVRAIHLEAFD